MSSSTRVQTTVRVDAFGTEAVMVLTNPAVAPTAEALLRRELDAVDLACSRFRSDAELMQLYRRPGAWVPVSDVLFDALSTARRVAEETSGAVDPTVACAMERLGYDRDFAAVPAMSPASAEPQPAPGWRVLELDSRTACARIPAGVRLDLGASAKALAADRAAAKVAALGTGVILSIGGDVAMAGPAPSTGWHVGIAADCGTAPNQVDEVVALRSGGLASSSTTLRTWERGGRRVHHIVDPTTGDCVPVVWQLVSVAAGTCVEANAASTAAVVWGEPAPERLEAMGLPARLVRHDGAVVTTTRWPCAATAGTDAPAPADAAGRRRMLRRSPSPQTRRAPRLVAPSRQRRRAKDAPA